MTDPHIKCVCVCMSERVTLVFERGGVWGIEHGNSLTGLRVLLERHA